MLYIKYSLGLKGHYPYIIALNLVAVIASVFLWQAIIVKWGKKTTLFVGLSITLPALIVLLFLNFFPYGVYLIIIVLAMGVSAAYLVPW